MIDLEKYLSIKLSELSKIPDLSLNKAVETLKEEKKNQLIYDLVSEHNELLEKVSQLSEKLAKLERCLDNLEDDDIKTKFIKSWGRCL